MKKSKRDDLLERKKEWLDHQYDPGHFTGGNIHPVFEGRRPNKYGYVLMAVGSVGFLMTIYSALYTPRAERWALLPGMVFAILAVVAGFKLIKKVRRKRGSN